MRIHWKPMLRQQFGAALDILERTIQVCPADLWAAQLWDDEDGEQEFGQTWGLITHTLVWLDLYLTGQAEGFAPPPPFTRGKLPATPYGKAQLLAYLDACRAKLTATIDGLNEATANRLCRFRWMEPSFVELQLYTMRHVVEHTAHVNLLIGQHGYPAPQDVVDYVYKEGSDDMDIPWQEIIWRQYGAALDVLGDAIAACPAELWRGRLYDDPDARPEYAEVWYRAYHALFWVDLYLFGAEEGFLPPAPLGLIEMEVDDLPDRVYTKEELQTYWAICRHKTRETLLGLDDETAARRCRFAWGEVSFLELQLYSMRHVQEHAAQLSLFLGQHSLPSPDWVSMARPDNRPL